MIRNSSSDGSTDDDMQNTTNYNQKD